MKSTSRIALVGAALVCPLALAWAAPRARKSKTARRVPVRISRTPQAAPAKKVAPKVAPIDQAKLPRYVSLNTIRRIQKDYRAEPMPALQPFWQGQALKRPMSNLLSGPAFDAPAAAKGKKAPVYLAQGFPRPVPPAAVPSGGRGGARPTIPAWVRYPLEFQLCGIGLGTKAVDKDRFNRIDRYGIFALHGNPTAVVKRVPAAFLGEGGGGGAAGGGGGGRGGGGGASAGGGGEAGGGEATFGNLTLPQTPVEATALFPQSPIGGLPDWALAVTVQLNDNQVEWLYKRDTYAMGFVIDRLGFCEAIIVAGIQSPIARTQQEDPVHTVKLGDDLRKVMNRYGYPDDIVVLANDPQTETNPSRGDSAVVAAGQGGGGGAAAGGGGTAGGRGGGLAAGGGEAGGGGGDAGGGGGGNGLPGSVGGISRSMFTSPVLTPEETQNEILNATYRTYDLRYDQTYNAVFTIRNNRVVRMYIFGDPDFFNAQRRNALRTRY